MYVSFEKNMKFLVGIVKEKRTLLRPRCKWLECFFVHDKDRMSQGMDCIHLQNRAKLWAIVELGNKYRLS